MEKGTLSRGEGGWGSFAGLKEFLYLRSNTESKSWVKQEGWNMGRINKEVLLEMLRAANITQNQIAVHFGVTEAAISKMKKKLLPVVPESFASLSEKEKRFVLARVEGKTATQAALASFECGSMASAKNIGSQLVKRDDIQIAISLIMEEEGIGRRHRIRALKKHIDNQHDAQASLKGIDIANKMEGIYVEKQIQVHASYSDLQKSLAELLEKRKQLEMELGISEEGVA
jgi:phage terminase small subunit